MQAQGLDRRTQRSTRPITRSGSRRPTGRKAPPLVVLLSALALVSAGCGSSSKESTGTATTASTAAATTATTTTTSTSSESGLSGKWKGQYSGAYSGTFVLNWQQSGASLSGKIKLSAPPSELGVNGTLNGSAITFGTVGSLAITYTGTVSGSSMSGSYHTPGGGGSWSAGKG